MTTSTSLQAIPRRNHRPYNNNRSNKRGHGSFRHRRRSQNTARKEWLQEATHRIIASPKGSLKQGKWHEITSLFQGWAGMAKFDKEAPLRMESLLKRLLQEEQAQGRNDLVVWDNRCTMHRGTDYDDIRWPRDVQRATIADVHAPSAT